MKLEFVTVDAFTECAFGGNPAAVAFETADHSGLDDAVRQKIAAEMNLSETAFVRAVDADKGVYNLRWFTPTVEVNLCGHATLATAHALFAERQVNVPQLRFQTLSGELIVQRLDDGQLQMTFPLV